MLKPVVLLALLLAPNFVYAAKCPVINGKYLKDVYQNGILIGRQPFVMFTREERGVFSYTVDGTSNFLVADGKPHPSKFSDFEVRISLTCIEGLLHYELRYLDGMGGSLQKISAASESELRIESSDPAYSGVYLKRQ